MVVVPMVVVSAPSVAQTPEPAVVDAPVTPAATEGQPAASDTQPAPAAVTPAVVAPAPVAPVARGRRVYVAPFTGETSDPATLDLVEDRVLVAARSAVARVDDARNIELIGARDVQSILDVEASKAAVGCDTTSCANEIADALNADEIVFGQLGRIGDTWQLTLTRTHRESLRVLGRSVQEARGDTPEGLLDDIGAQVDELFDLAPTGPTTLSVIGMGTTAVGAAALAVGVGAYAYSWIEWGNASSILASDAPNVTRAKQHETDGRNALTFAYVVGGVGAAVAATGAALWFVGGAE
jgi:hypothetical protein